MIYCDSLARQLMSNFMKKMLPFSNLSNAYSKQGKIVPFQNTWNIISINY